MATIFDALPSAIVEEVWQIGERVHSTEVGDRPGALWPLSVIVDEESSVTNGAGATTDGVVGNTLLYASPAELPTADPAALVEGFLVRNTETGQFYQIEKAGAGKNQATGEIEHVELFLRPTEVNEDE